MRFKIAGVSSNTNSFGLSQFIFVSREGVALAACKYQPTSEYKKDDIVELSEPYTSALSNLGFELPNQIAAPPQAVIDEIWVTACNPVLDL